VIGTGLKGAFGASGHIFREIDAAWVVVAEVLDLLGLERWVLLRRGRWHVIDL